MSNLVDVISVLVNKGNQKLALEVTELFHKNMSYLPEFEQVCQSYYVLGKLDKAIKVGENALALSPSSSTSYTYRTNLANLYLKAGKSKRALIYIELNEKISPSKELAYLRLMAEQMIEKDAGVAKTGFWSDDLAKKYHQHCEELSEWICKFLSKNHKVYDFGCGLGKYLRDLKNHGFTDLQGYEGVVPSTKAFDNINQQDLTQSFNVSEKGHVICLEVGEHIPAEYSDVFLDSICGACCDKFIFSWAIRGQGGTGHVNCLNNDEVIPMVEKRGFRFLARETIEARSVITKNATWFKDSLLIFERT